MAVFGKYIGDSGRYYTPLDLGPLTNGVVVDFTSLNGGSYPADGRWQSDAGPATYAPPTAPTAYVAPIDHGPFANRPAAAQLANQRYVATDLSLDYYSDGSTWYTLGSAASAPTRTALTASTTVAPVAVSNDVLLDITMDANLTLTLTATNGTVTGVTLAPKQDGTGGRTLTITNADWGTAGAPTLSAATKRDFISALSWDGGATWFCFLAGSGGF